MTMSASALRCSKAGGQETTLSGHSSCDPTRSPRPPTVLLQGSHLRLRLWPRSHTRHETFFSRERLSPSEVCVPMTKPLSFRDRSPLTASAVFMALGIGYLSAAVAMLL